VMGSLPSLTQLTARVASAYDAVLVGCTERLLLSPAFRTRAHQLSRTARLIALMASPTAEAGAQAASLGFVGLVSRHVTPTAHKHVQNALRRLNAKTRSQLVASARQPAFRGSFD